MFSNEKSREWFNPSEYKLPVHIIGVGAVGSSVAELLCRLGFKKIHIWDADKVSSHNLGNQIYREQDIQQLKTTALTDILKNINGDISVVQHGLCTADSIICGSIFLTIDNIDTRNELVKPWSLNPDIDFITDCRMTLTAGQIYAADWKDKNARKALANTMQFTHEEAKEATPVTACGTTMNVVMAPRAAAMMAVSNWIKFQKTKQYSKVTLIDPYAGILETL